MTERQEIVLLIMAEGYTDREIASELLLSTDTVKTEVARIVSHLGARNRTHAVALAYHRGILRPKVLAE